MSLARSATGTAPLAMASADPGRGEIWLVSFGSAPRGEPGKNRPAIVISVDDVLVGSDDELIVVIPLSTSRAPSALRPNVSIEEGPHKSSVAVCRGIRAVSRTRLLEKIGELRFDTLARIEQAMATVLGLDTAGNR